MANLLKETLEVLDNLGIKEEEVVYVVNRRNPRDCKFMTWEMFKDLARNKNYDDGLGPPKSIPILSFTALNIFYIATNMMVQKDGKKSQHQSTCSIYYLGKHQKYSLLMSSYHFLLFFTIIVYYNIGRNKSNNGLK